MLCARMMVLTGLTTMALTASAPVWAADQTHMVKFKAGASSATLKGALKGYDGVKYILGAGQGQGMSVRLAPSNTSCYFNILPPGSEEAVFNGSIKGNEFSGTLAASGDYVVVREELLIA